MVLHQRHAGDAKYSGAGGFAGLPAYLPADPPFPVDFRDHHFRTQQAKGSASPQGRPSRARPRGKANGRPRAGEPPLKRFPEKPSPRRTLATRADPLARPPVTASVIAVGKQSPRMITAPAGSCFRPTFGWLLSKQNGPLPQCLKPRSEPMLIFGSLSGRDRSFKKRVPPGGKLLRFDDCSSPVAGNFVVIARFASSMR